MMTTERKTWLEQWDIEGSRGDQYVVSQKADGSFACSCPAWKFHRAPKSDCKHICALKENIGTETRVRGLVPVKKPVAPVPYSDTFTVKRKFRFDEGD